VGRDLRIRRFTPATQKTLKLIPSDVGRLITDLQPDIQIPDLEKQIRQVPNKLGSQTNRLPIPLKAARPQLTQ